ncbi:hypothetical protein Ac2012v2_003412 [Leucoagaricus gongylophorus]
MVSTASLSPHIKGDIVTPDHPDYRKSLRRWAINAERNAAVVIFPKDEDDISKAIIFAKENDLATAIRGGGHSPAGASSVEGGLVIDLSRYFNGVRVDPVKRLAYIGGGAIWETVDKAAIEHGLATVGGTVNHTGVGGLILGGGFGWLSGEHGLAIDNLHQATVVCADGSVHVASETENSDLFFGLRGGGSNFGVVTEFVLILHPQRKTVFAGPVVFPYDYLGNIIDFAKDWYLNVTEREGMLLVTTVQPDGTPIVVCNVFFNGSEEEGRAKYKKLYDIGPVADLAKEIPFELLNSTQNHMAPHGDGVYWKGVTHNGPALEPITQAHEKAVEIVKNGKFLATLLYEWISLEKINSVPVNKTAYRRLSVPNCLVSISWPGNTHSADKVDEARSLTRQLAARVAGGELSSKNQGYANYDPEGVRGDKAEVKNQAAVVFGGNYRRLQEIKKKYDPENVFNRWFAITPA